MSRNKALRTGSLLAIFAVTLSVTILALALAMSAIYVIQTPPVFWNNVAFTFLMILLITLPTALLVSKVSFDVFVLQKKLRKVMRYDQLTGTLRKEEFFKDLRHAKALDNGVALMLDVDDLSKIVDDYGYDATDDILKVIAETMKNAVRDDDKVCRLGFEKFIVMLTSVTLEDGLSVARRIQDTISGSPVVSGKHMIPISVSIGAVSIEQNGDIDHVVEMAGHELIQAKAAGTNRISYEKTEAATLTTETDLRQAQAIN